MKPGRNAPCPCGSGIKYKRCCMASVSTPHAEIHDEIAQTLAMNPNLTLDELNLVAQQRVHERNNRPDDDFCGLSPNQMTNWLYAPFSELTGVEISTPDDVSSSPVMRYLAIILDEAMQNGGSFKATGKGNLPVKLVKQAGDLLSEFAVAKCGDSFSVSEFSGCNEDKFNALHYARILAETAGIIYRKKGHYHIKKAAIKQYQAEGINGFFLPMLEAAIYQYNWGYLDSWEHDIDLRTFWVFMLWRLQCHGSVEQLIEEVATAFPDLLHLLTPEEYFSPIQLLGMLVETRFIERFLQFWGFITLGQRRIFAENSSSNKVTIQPLLMQAFHFNFSH